MATSRNDILSETAIAFMQTMNIAFTITNAKPETTLYAFFDGVSVDKDITQTGNIKGELVITDTAGQATGIFFVAAAKYNTGTKLLKFQDDENFNTNIIPGSTVSSAEASFTSSGILRTTRETITTVNTIVESSTIINNVIGGLGDPLAESFFTHGVTGGVNVTSIDIFFQSKAKNGTIPVTLEIREMVAGYPSTTLVSEFSRVVLRPDDVHISNNALTATSFVFDTPIFLPENRDWCFVLLSNSDKYNVWTAKIGESSIETGKTIFEQPFIGSLFKSENNITWTTDSTEDIKFNIHKAVYNLGGASVTLKAKASKVLIYGKNMRVTSGSNVINIKLNYMHGLRNGDKVRILAPVGSSTYRGILASQLSGLYICTYIDDYIIEIQLASGKFTSTGTLEVPGIVNEIQVDFGGIGYTTTPIITIVGACITQATATVQTQDGVITSVTMTNNGSGYLVKPSIVLSGSGSGASFGLISETVIQIETNRVYDEVLPRIANYTPALTRVSSTLKTTNAEYLIKAPVLSVLNVNNILSNKSILISSDNGAAFLPMQSTTELVLNMESENINISSLLSISEKPTLECRAYIINNQTEWETITPSTTNGSAFVASMYVGLAGSGYTSNVVNVSKPNLLGGTPATAVAILTNTTVTGITITNPGSGYTSPPTVKMNQIVDSSATLFATISAFNTELLYIGGSAKSRYLTKPITLNTVSTGVTIFANAFSSVSSNFDFYFRTSLRSAAISHTSLPWKMMFCDKNRNMSTMPNEYIDYTFYLNNLNPFDVYDIKIVLRSTNRSSIPSIANYRCIILAT